MAYREELEHLKARLRELEDELASARAQLAAGRAEQLEPANFASLLRGGPGELRVERGVVAELDDAAAEEILELVRSRLGHVGEVQRIGRSLTFSSARGSSRTVEITVATLRGQTRVRATESLGSVAGALFGGVVGGVGGGGMGVVIPLLGLAGALRLMTVAGVLWLALVYLLTRGLYRRVVTRRLRELESLTAEIVARLEPGPPHR